MEEKGSAGKKRGNVGLQAERKTDRRACRKVVKLIGRQASRNGHGQRQAGMQVQIGAGRH